MISAPDIAVVIPVRNEADTLPALLAGIAAQTLAPHEIIVIDAGSTDDSVAIVEKWAVGRGLGQDRVRVITNPGGMPGSNRNRGVIEARSEWIAFVDAGLVPAADWLACLWDCAESAGSRAIFGQCHFEADSAFEKAVCALSYGCGASLPVLPASLFHRSIFDQAGLFREDLRAAEDFLWMREVERIYGPRVICTEALVHYRHFPATISAVVSKWWLYQHHSIRAGLNSLQSGLMAVFFCLLILSLFTAPIFGGGILLVYVFVRGVIDPMRRSHALVWWGDKPVAVLIAMGLGVTLDATKTLAGLVAWTLDHEGN